ncbi:DUF1308 domain-containing protein [Sulfidibacter corallicola]|uniref:DUF1308 domain-containing protein n=1 Tax=Sulfidibacter corallicola TaxID=2818388 RepID=A0A8A4TFN6_SULCO|nr:RHS repeat-associated core domain-containing protein [Sulfidibacter corallicola]QTD48899.1 DUF1308 domain-containing protein [Sulfidibacter corallicola]
MTSFKGMSPFRKWEFVDLDKNHFRFEPPDLFPTFSYEHSVVSGIEPPPRVQLGQPSNLQSGLTESAHVESAIKLQKDLEIQRMEILLCQDPGHILRYGAQMATALALNHELLEQLIRGRLGRRRLEALVVQAGFHYTWLGRFPESRFIGTEHWWRTLTRLRSLGIEIPTDHAHPVPKTGVLAGRTLHQVIENMRNGIFFSGTSELLESDDGGASVSSGRTTSHAKPKAKSKPQPPPAPRPAPAPPPVANQTAAPSLGPNGEIVGDTNPPVAPETEEESSWWGGLTSAISNMSLSDIVHTTLDVVGLVPGLGEVADGLNALIYLAEGNYTDAALSAAAMIPFAGAAATAAKFGKKGLAAADTLADGIKVGKKVSKPGTPPVKKCTTAGCPISVVTGEELLQHKDFVLRGTLPFVWERTYRTGHDADFGMGHGWSYPGVERIDLHGEEAVLRDEEGRQIFFPEPEVGETVYQAIDKLFLRREDRDTLVLEADQKPTKVFKAVDDGFTLSEIRDMHDNVVRFHRGQGGRLARIETSSGRAVALVWDQNGHISHIAPADVQGKIGDEPLAVYRYDAQADMIEAVDRLGHSEQYGYRNHILVQRTLKTGFRYFFEWDRYDTEARCTRNWGDDGKYDYRFDWQPDRRQSTIIDSNGGETRYRFDAHGNIVEIRDPLGHRTHYRFDASNNLCETIDPLGHRMRYTYDARDRLVEVRNKLGNRTRFHYDGQGRPTGVLDAANQHWQRSYDAKGSLEAVRDALGRETRYRRDARGQITEIAQSGNVVKRMVWNARGELLAETDAVGRTTTYSYDTEGNLVAITGHDDGRHRFELDAMGRIVRMERPDGRTVSCAYNENGMMTRFVDAAGRETRYEYAGLSAVVRRIDPDGTRFRYEYDREQNLTALINQRGERYSLSYDANERLIAEVGFDGREQRYHYDPVGNLVRLEDGLFRTIDYRHDAMGQMIQKVSHHAGTGKRETTELDYDGLGRLVRATNPHRDLRFYYDPANRLVEEWQDDHILTHGFDDAGRPTQTRFDSQVLDYDFDALGRFAGVAGDRQMIHQVAYDDAAGQVTRRFGNGLSAEHSYDPMGRLKRQKTLLPGALGNQLFFGRDYDYDDAGNLSQIKELATGHVTRYHYDHNNRLIEADGILRELFAFDPAGNLIDGGTPTEPARPLEGGYVKGNRLLVYQDKKFEYDDVGNLVKRVQGHAGCDITEFAYDAENRMIRSVRHGVATTYRYDALGRRIAKQTLSERTRFFWNGDVLLREERDDQATTYVYQPNTFLPLAQIREEGTFHYHLDHLGTPHIMTDDRGGLAWSAQFTAFGKITEFDREQVDNPLRFQGQYFDRETGLHYNYHRYYDPDVGRFTSPDPIGLLGGEHHYQYAPNPIGWIDPYGLMCKELDAGNAVNIDTGSASAFISQDSPIRHQLKTQLGDRQMVMTETAAAEFQGMLRVAGPEETARAQRFLKRVNIIPDNPSKRAMDLNTTKKVGANDKVIFGTGDQLSIPTMTGDAKFLRGASAQGVDFDAIVHDPVPLKGL